MESMERKIDRIKGFVVDLTNSSDVPPNFPESMSKSHSATPIHIVSPLTLSTSLIQNTQEGSSLYSLALQKALDGLERMGNEKEGGNKPSSYMYDNKLKRKITEPVIEEVMMHNKFGLVKQQFKDKGKIMIKPPKFKTRKPQVMTQLAEPPAITFEMLRSHGILQPKNDGIPNPLRNDFDPKKHCAFHSGMQGHDTNECHHLRKRYKS
ncbi:hypothetical protein HAX54_023923 [Datura stramonium]|uniref:Retrotransposon gag protein n=1 Tax=Datura stramonium TaxID=4076 RepID=A0ABS8UX38_DATST|nr:hypothetical protein [Datura stramonium]